VNTMPTEPTTTIYGLAASYEDPQDAVYGDAVNNALRVLYPNVTFEPVWSGEFNRLHRGNNVDDVTDQVDYEDVWTMTMDELAAIVEAAS